MVNITAGPSTTPHETPQNKQNDKPNKTTELKRGENEEQLNELKPHLERRKSAEVLALRSEAPTGLGQSPVPWSCTKVKLQLMKTTTK